MTLMVRCSRHTASDSPLVRRSAPTTPPSKAVPTPRERLWECTLEFSADGGTDSYTSRHRAVTQEAALAANLAAAEREYGGGWDEITSHTARLAK